MLYLRAFPRLQPRATRLSGTTTPSVAVLSPDRICTCTRMRHSVSAITVACNQRRKKFNERLCSRCGALVQRGMARLGGESGNGGRPTPEGSLMSERTAVPRYTPDYDLNLGASGVLLLTVGFDFGVNLAGGRLTGPPFFSRAAIRPNPRHLYCHSCIGRWQARIFLRPYRMKREIT